MQTTNLVMQNAVEQRDLGAASGASTLFRTIGGSLGVSLLGVIYANRLTGDLTTQLGAAQAGRLAGGHLTPAALHQLPAAVGTAYRTAVASGVTTAFLWAAVVAVVAVVAATLIREVSLRGSAPEAPRGSAPEAPRVSSAPDAPHGSAPDAWGSGRHARPESEPRHALADA